MAFQNYSSIQAVVCPSCQGTGCSECENFGVYALSQDKTLTFSLPSYLDIEKRKKVKTVFFLKKILLLAVFMIILVAFWSIINGY